MIKINRIIEAVRTLVVGNSKKTFTYDNTTDLIAADLDIGSYAWVDGTKYKISSTGTGITLANNNIAVKIWGALSDIIGAGQTWQDLSTSRFVSTIYTNTTSKPISISINIISFFTGSNNVVNGDLVLYDSSDNIIMTKKFTTKADPTTDVRQPLSLEIIQPGEKYALYAASSTGSISLNWYELRE